MDVKAIYELPVPIWVTTATLGATYSSGYGPVRFDIVMPLDRPPVGMAPAIEGLDQSALSRMHVSEEPDDLVGELVVWTQEYGAFIPESLRPATALIRVVVSGVQAPKHATRTLAGPDDRLVEVIALVRPGSQLDRGADRSGSRPTTPRLRRRGRRTWVDLHRPATRRESRVDHCDSAHSASPGAGVANGHGRGA